MTATRSDKQQKKDMTTILAYLNDIASAVIYAAQGEDLDVVLERIAEISRELVDARYAALGLPNHQGGIGTFKFVGMSHKQIKEIGQLPQGHGLLGALMHERQPIRLEDMATDPRSCGFPENHPPMKRFLGVPIQTADQLFGMLYLADRKDGKPFTQQDQWVIEMMAGYAALAIAGTILSNQKQRLTLLEERERIGMELHDGIIQSLYAIGMQIELLRTSEAGQIAPEELKPAINALNDVIEDIRSYIMNLKIKNYRQSTTRQCMMDIVGRLHVADDVDIIIEAPDDLPPFTPPIFEGICQIINEAVSNALRHANPSTITIAVNQSDDAFEALVIDDGAGFDPDRVGTHSGLGLRNIKQRAQLQGGTVEIETAAGEGTCVRLTLPLRY